MNHNSRIASTTPLPPLVDFGPRSVDPRVHQARSDVADAMHGRSNDLWVFAGPCSVHDPEAVFDYAVGLAELARRVENLRVGIRVYPEKPRTSIGWPGMLTDPHMDSTYDVTAGIERTRSLMADIVALDLPIVAELVDPSLANYYADFVSYATVGARSVSNQTHHNLASGLSMPSGFKNDVAGQVAPAVHACVKASTPRQFTGVDDFGRAASLTTTGNPDCNVVLRGGTTPNYGPNSIRSARSLAIDLGINTLVTVDASHGNSGGDPLRQVEVASSVASSRRLTGSDVWAVMIESFTRGGRQDRPTEKGKSVTDACLGWPDTYDLICELDKIMGRPDGAARSLTRSQR